LAADKATILIVDDEPANRDVLEQELADAGYRTRSAASGEEALQKAQCDLILLDVMMGGIDGYETCRRLKAGADTQAIPVIFLTALSESFEKVRGFGAGAVDYVTKPFDIEELLARIRTHLSLRKQMEKDRPALTDSLSLIGASQAIARVKTQIAQVARTDSSVLIQGETGTGKELVAAAIHEQSRRKSRPLVKVNCAALPRDLVESELFGHEKGAFTGAAQQRQGRFELADGGTLFLDEVGELPPEAQAKLLRALQEREFERVGGTKTIRVDVRVIAATNRDLQQSLRPDLYYRLNVFPISLPPLRERREDIPVLVQHLAEKAARKLGRELEAVSPAFLARAAGHDWPGNVRELENVIERALIMSGGSLLDGADVFTPVTAPEAKPSMNTLEDMERAYIERVLDATNWQVEGEGGAAQVLGLNPSTLRGRLRKLGIRRRI
jgi:DNA-binding NtrC family response regulator